MAATYYHNVYVRARRYPHLDSGWTTRDPFWPSEMPYGYVNGKPMANSDPSDISPCREHYNKISKWSAMRIKTCPREFTLTLSYVDIYSCPAGLRSIKHKIPCVDMYVRLFIHSGDKGRYGSGSAMASAVYCTKYKDPKVAGICAAILAALWLMAEQCTKKNGDICIFRYKSTCLNVIPTYATGCCTGFGK